MLETRPKAFVFVLMPFSDTFSDIYEVGIKAACKEAGAYCERVDEQIFDGNILERVYNQIAKADVIVAEMTGRNPNVFYEVGYAHALNKRVILLTQDADDIPFDLKQLPHIVYGGKIAMLKRELEARVRWCIENPQESLAKVDVDFEFLVNGAPLVDTPVFKISQDTYEGIYLKIDIHNPKGIKIDPDDFNLALFSQRTIFYRVVEEGLSLPITEVSDGSRLCNLQKLIPLHPKSWHTIHLSIDISRSTVNNDSYEIRLRLFTEVGFKDYPFILQRN